MAVSITTDLTTIYDANTSVAGADTFSGFQRFGSACNGVQVSNSTNHYVGTVTSFNFTGQSIYSWMVAPGSVGTLSQGGYRIIIGDGTNTRAYYVGGRDYKAFSSQGWFCFVLNSDNLPTNFTQINGSVEPNLTAITQVGVGFTTTSKASGNSPNCFFDIARYGTGLTISGGTTGDRGRMSEVVAQDDLTSNAWGVVEELGAGIFGVQGRLTFGDTGGASYFHEEDSVIYFEDRVVADSFYQLNVVGSSTNTNEFSWGQKVGTGDAAVGGNGVTILGARPFSVDFSGQDINVLNIYGSTIANATNGVTLSTNAAHEFVGNTVAESGQVIANQAVIRTSFFNATTASAALLWNNSINIRNSNFNGNTDAVENPAAIEHPATGTFTYDNLRFSGNDVDVLNTSGGLVTINAANASNPATSTGNTDILNTQLFKLTGLIPNSEVRIYRESDGVELAGVENSTDEFDFSYNYTGDTPVNVYIHHIEYQWLGIQSTLTASGVTIPVQQRFDRVYFNPE